MAGVFAGIHVRACVREDDALQRLGRLVLRRRPRECERVSLGRQGLARLKCWMRTLYVLR
jgi:hypothetical protein